MRPSIEILKESREVQGKATPGDWYLETCGPNYTVGGWHHWELPEKAQMALEKIQRILNGEDE